MKVMNVKLCGNHSLQDFKYTFNSGVPYIGIVFAKSKRKVDPVVCGDWLREIDKQPHQQLIGVFVNPTLEDVLFVLRYVGLDIIQFHGLETPSEIETIKQSTGLKVWKAIHHENDQGKNRMKLYEGVVDGYIVDSKVKGAWGGTGLTFDWQEIPTYVEEAKRQGVPCFIAGGITPENVEDILIYNPDGIDLSSGIETNGQKDEHKIRILLERLKDNDDNLS